MDQIKYSKNLNIKLNKINSIIDRIYDRYPLIEKWQIAFIVRSFFEEIRYLLVQGNKINIYNFVNNMKLDIRYGNFKNKDLPIIKMSLSTPKKIKNAKF